MVNRCQCGKRMGKNSNCCNTCHKAKMAKIRAEAIAIVSTGKCPVCGNSLRSNLSIIGWFQCSQYGAEQFRVDPSKPSCTFQCFTE